LGWESVLVVLALMLLCVPLIIWHQFESRINWRQQFFLSWVAPRGIVAAFNSVIILNLQQGISGGDAFGVSYHSRDRLCSTHSRLGRQLPGLRANRVGTVVVGNHPFAIVGSWRFNASEKRSLIDSIPALQAKLSL